MSVRICAISNIRNNAAGLTTQVPMRAVFDVAGDTP
jgi:hypothetical protein